MSEPIICPFCENGSIEKPELDQYHRLKAVNDLVNTDVDWPVDTYSHKYVWYRFADHVFKQAEELGVYYRKDAKYHISTVLECFWKIIDKIKVNIIVLDRQRQLVALVPKLLEGVQLKRRNDEWICNWCLKTVSDVGVLGSSLICKNPHCVAVKARKLLEEKS